MVDYGNEADLAAIADELFDGNVTGTVRIAADEDTPTLRKLVDWITVHVGRALFVVGWPTGALQ